MRLENPFLEGFVSRIDWSCRPFYLFLASQRWIGIRLDFVSNVITTTSVTLVILLRDQLSAGLAAVVLVNVLNLTGMLQFGVRQAAEVENLMTSVERVHAYSTDLPSEETLPAPAVTMGW